MFKKIGIVALLLGGIAVQPAASLAQNYPSRPIRFITNGGPGTASDLLLRIVSAAASETLGQQVLVEPKLGGGGVIAYEYVAKEAPADGYTFLLGNLSLTALFPLTIKNLSFDPIKDLQPVVGLAELRLALVSPPDSPWRDFNDMVTQVKASPNKYFFGSNSVFSSLWTEGLLGHYGLNVTEVKYGDQAETYRDLMAGTINILFTTVANVRTLANGDRLEILAVTSPDRDPELPNVPTITELGAPELAIGGNFTLMARTGTPKAAMDKVQDAVTRALARPDVKAALDKAAIPTLVRTPEQVTTTEDELVKTFAEIAQRIGLKPQ